MKLKTYHAPSLHAALRLARIELGSEAMLLEAKEKESETAEARFQVTFALGADGEVIPTPPSNLDRPHWKTFLQDEPGEPAKPLAQAKPHKPAARKKKRLAPPKPALASETSSFQDALGALRTPELAAIFGRLVGAGLAPGEAVTLVGRAEQTAGPAGQDAAILESALRDVLDEGWKVHSAPEPKRPAGRILAFAGPAGAGKTTTAVKAAMLLLRAYDRPVALVSFGRHPIGGVDPLEAWATLLNVRLEIAESPEELPAALERIAASSRPPGAVILDTPPAPGALEALSDVKGLERHLVLPAVYSPADLNRAVERYGGAAFDAVAFTRLDEAAAPGSLWTFQRTTGLPFSFLGCGPNVPGDLQPATAKRLTQRLFGR